MANTFHDNVGQVWKIRVTITQDDNPAYKDNFIADVAMYLDAKSIKHFYLEGSLASIGKFVADFEQNFNLPA